jgi:chromosome segregation ATPase
MATDPLDDMPRIRLEKDDLESFHRTRAQSSNKSSKKVNSPDKSINTSNSPSWFAFLFLLIMIVSATSYWSVGQYKALQQAQNRITDLENRLYATGENMDQSAEALQIKVSKLSVKTEDLWNQMDKLWASAWRRNQSEIGVLNKTVMAVKASSEKSTRALSSETSDNNTIIGLVKEQLESQANLLKQLNNKFGQSNNVDDNFEQQLASLREKLISTALINNNLTNQIDVLRKRVSVTEKKANEIQLSPTPNITPIQ